MPRKIKYSKIEKYRDNAVSLAQHLGEELAGWILSPEAREKAQVRAPQLPTDKGAAVVLFRGDGKGGCLAEGFALPFSWCKGRDASESQAPSDLVQKADDVRKMLEEYYNNTAKKNAERLDLDGWWLDIHPTLKHLDLHVLPFSVESAALPLAVALLLALRGGQPGARVLCTGAIDSNGYIDSVDGYQEKLIAASRLFPLQSKNDRILFLPPVDFPKAQQEASEFHVQLKTFDANRPFEELLESVLVEMDQPPEKDADLKEHLTYANRPHMAKNFRLRNNYYTEHIVGKLGRQVRVREDFPVKRTKRLLLPVSLAPGNAMLSLASLQPEEVMLVVSKESSKHYERLHSFAKSLGTVDVKKKLIPIEDEEVSPEDIHYMGKWLREVSPEECRIVDFTPGTREMLAAVLTAGLNSQAKLLYARHSLLPDSNAVDFGTVRFVEFSMPENP